jgi:GNAT superfamily N-acetyltransferase
MEIRIINATLAHLEDITNLFDAYRVFYGQESNKSAARQFISDRIQLNESQIFIAYSDGKAFGFTQLYPVFSSVTLERSYILNDLFVTEEFRNQGIGKALLDEAKKITGDKNFKGLALETHSDNPARRLYEKEGWKMDAEFIHYFWTNNSK